MERDPIHVAADAKNLLENQLFKDAFKAVGEYIEQKALSCDPDNKEAAQRVVISKQILAGIKREIERQVETGLIAEVKLSEIEKKRAFRMFQR
jgi:hypothetical protein